MTHQEVETILMYHNQKGFEMDIADMRSRVNDLRNSQTEIKSFYFSLAIPANKNLCSPVEITIINNMSVSEMEIKANELERFVNNINTAIDGLTSLEKEVIHARYMTKTGEVVTFDELTKKLFKAHSTIVEINNRALTKLGLLIDKFNNNRFGIVMMNNVTFVSAVW